MERITEAILKQLQDEIPSLIKELSILLEESVKATGQDANVHGSYHSAATHWQKISELLGVEWETWEFHIDVDVGDGV